MMGARGRVLVIDDELSIQEIVRLILEKQGYEVAVAADGQEAVDAFTRFDPDLVVSDVAMPKGDGFNVAIHIRAREAEGGKRTPILLMSAFYEEESNRDNTSRCGADAFLGKPFTHAQLIEKVEGLLAKARA
jgi:two-component system, OmpR family, response regulator ResD